MPAAENDVVEGIFAINKPSGSSSAKIVGNLKHAFNRSTLFAPLLEAQQHNNDRNGSSGRRRNKNAKRPQVKIGHGGTLDPLATGVLIIGVGKGTKRLQDYLSCTKTYEATVLFGAATDSYDTEGRILKRAPFESLTRQKVEDALHQFRGKIMQRPPLYSALKMNGKRLCDYARENKEIPRNIEERPIEVKELEILEWVDGGEHEFSVRDEEADAESKEVAQALLHLGDGDPMSPIGGRGNGPELRSEGSKRKRSFDDAEDQAVSNKRPALSREDTDPTTLMSGGLQPLPEEQGPAEADKATSENDAIAQSTAESGSAPPAVKLRMTVTSGFYVRSLAHDLGEAVGSLACMCSLVRTRQGDHQLGENVLEYGDVEQPEEIWGPKVKALIDSSGENQSIDWGHNHSPE